MSEVKPKQIKPGKRGYTLEEIADNIQRFIKAKSCGKIEMRVHNRRVVQVKMLGAVDVITSSQPQAAPARPPLPVYTIKDVIANVKHFLKENSFGNIEMRVHNRQLVDLEMLGAMDVIRKSQPNANQSRNASRRNHANTAEYSV